jgi:hypothetical protein
MVHITLANRKTKLLIKVTIVNLTVNEHIMNVKRQGCWAK